MSVAARRDVSGKRMAPGKRYMLTQPGARPVAVRVIEDEFTDLWIEHQKGPDGSTVWQRVDELSPDVRFHSVQHYVADAIESQASELVQRIEEHLRRASEFRQQLRLITDEISQMVGGEPYDGTLLSDLVVSAVHDGHSSAIEIADVSGKLH